MSDGLWRVQAGGEVRLARGDPDAGPAELLPAPLTIDGLLAEGGDAIDRALDGPADGPVPQRATVLAPLQGQEVWAAGLTFVRSRDARKEESGTPDHYDLVYEAERPELFFKAAPGRARGPGEAVGVRRDSTWDVPEPELAVVADAAGRLVACTVGNDVSSRSIEGENPLYLPQAKVYRGSCAVGPCLVPRSRLPDLDQMVVSLSIWRNGSEVFTESMSLSSMRRRPGELLDWLYRGLDFPVGVVLLTGTSIVPGPDFTLGPGDDVTVAVTGLGRLHNRVETVG
ncbi:MAG: fumarylacetoacetate hydrolase family protein [Acidimicrobiales bacterium]